MYFQCWYKLEAFLFQSALYFMLIRRSVHKKSSFGAKHNFDYFIVSIFLTQSNISLARFHCPIPSIYGGCDSITVSI